ncbi:hypothetical protein [Streptomyces syringium]|uniref:hypothetical protein n=1 Tax=Streptomyces syringium TaxID=76729 RepID=UPI0034182E81
MCGEIPEMPDLSGAIQVNFGAQRSLYQHWPDDELHVDEQARIAWFLRYNGAWRRLVAEQLRLVPRRVPLTEERAQLVAELRAEYASDDAPA